MLAAWVQNFAVTFSEFDAVQSYEKCTADSLDWSVLSLALLQISLVVLRMLTVHLMSNSTNSILMKLNCSDFSTQQQLKFQLITGTNCYIMWISLEWTVLKWTSGGRFWKTVHFHSKTSFDCESACILFTIERPPSFNNLESPISNFRTFAFSFTVKLSPTVQFQALPVNFPLGTVNCGHPLCSAKFEPYTLDLTRPHRENSYLCSELFPWFSIPFY